MDFKHLRTCLLLEKDDVENISFWSGQSSFSWAHLIIGERLTKDRHVSAT